MPSPSVKDLVTQMIRDLVTPRMKAEGFRRTGRTFWRDGPEVCHVAHVLMNRWGSATESSFDVHLGVFWHRVEKLLDNPSLGKMPPPEFRCTFRFNVGRLATKLSKPPKPDWRVTLKTDFDTLGREVLADLLKYALPWFEYRSDLKRALDSKRFNLSMGELVNADAKTVFKMMLGKRIDAVADLRRAIRIGYREDALTLAKRLKIPAKEITSQAL
jgi:hypothetical protein